MEAVPGHRRPAWANADVKIYDDDGNELAAGPDRHVYMLLGQANFEYKDAAEKTRDNRIGNYFTVGDVGELNEEGYLFLRDRKTDMIISGGANIYPAEIEAELIQHPKIADVAVFGIPHDDWGEEIKAVVQPADGVEPGEALTGRDPRVVRRPAGQDEAPALDRLHGRAAPRPQRQALQAQAARPLLGGSLPDLSRIRSAGITKRAHDLNRGPVSLGSTCFRHRPLSDLQAHFGTLRLTPEARALYQGESDAARIRPSDSA